MHHKKEDTLTKWPNPQIYPESFFSGEFKNLSQI